MSICIKRDKKIKLSIIGSVGLPANYGGWETLVDNVIKFIAKDLKITVFCSSKVYKTKIFKYKKAKLIYINLHPNGFQSIFYDLISMIYAIRISNIMLILGVSGCIFLPLIKIFYKGKIIVNTDGLESERLKWGYFTRIFLSFSEALAVKFADCIVVDNQGISNHILKKYGRKSMLIAYGGDHAKKIILSQNVKKTFNLPHRYAFKVARIEPENNIEMILNCFAKIKFSLVIVGNWQSSQYGKDLVKKFKKIPNIKILDAIYDLTILDQIRSNAYIYIHGHSVGGTNPSLVEAMSLGLPIFAYDVNFNRYTTDNSCLYFKNEKKLNLLIKNIDKNLIPRIANKMKLIANQKYKWSKISQQYLTLIRGL
jgi:glycosyltransferase involved in cell wall biosynthesis